EFDRANARRSVSLPTVEIAANRHHQPMLAGDPAEIKHHLRRMIGVVNFQTVEAEGDQGLNDWLIIGNTSGMGQHSHATRLMNNVDGTLWRQSIMRNVGGAIVGEIFIEGVLQRSHVSGFEHGLRDVRASNHAALCKGTNLLKGYG